MPRRRAARRRTSGRARRRRRDPGRSGRRAARRRERGLEVDLGRRTASTRASVSPTTSKASVPFRASTTVRQTPSTETESPTAGASVDSTTSLPSSNDATRPRSRTIPVNMVEGYGPGLDPRARTVSRSPRPSWTCSIHQVAPAWAYASWSSRSPGSGVAQHRDVAEVVAVEHRGELVGRRRHRAGVAVSANHPSKRWARARGLRAHAADPDRDRPGFGSSVTPSTRSARRGGRRALAGQHARITSRPSSSSSARACASSSSPKRSNSPWPPPRPAPNTTRPGASWSSVASSCATTCGRRRADRRHAGPDQDPLGRRGIARRASPRGRPRASPRRTRGGPRSGTRPTPRARPPAPRAPRCGVRVRADVRAEEPNFTAREGTPRGARRRRPEPTVRGSARRGVRNSRRKCGPCPRASVRRRRAACRSGRARGTPSRASARPRAAATARPPAASARSSRTGSPERSSSSEPAGSGPSPNAIRRG